MLNKLKAKIRKIFDFLDFVGRDADDHYKEIVSLEVIIALRDQKIEEYRTLVKNLKTEITELKADNKRRKAKIKKLKN